MILSLLVAVLAAAAGPLPPESLNTFSLSARRSIYEIDTPSCAIFGHRLTRLKFAAIGAAAHLGSLFIIYADGQALTIPLARTLRPGEQTRWIDLRVHGRPDNRCAATVRLVAGSPGAARLEVIGQSENLAPH